MEIEGRPLSSTELNTRRRKGKGDQDRRVFTMHVSAESADPER